MSTFVGIDLGTTFSVVAHINQNGQPQVIPDQQGNATTPSVVYLGAKKSIVGAEAKERQALGEMAVASFFKRHMGDPNFELMFDGKTYNATDLSALVLAHLKEYAEAYLGDQVTHAVVTVPAYFNNMQREATIEAGRRAGLQVLSILNEPTAAAFAFGLRPLSGGQTVLVYDLGGGTFDVSVVEITPTTQRVIGTGGDHNLGGKDWDDRIFTYLTDQFKQEFNLDLNEDDYNELLVTAENVKKGLSSRQSVDGRVQGSRVKGSYPITRELFESLTHDLMERTQRLTEQVLEDINLRWSDITGVLLVGGSTRMPMVKSYVERMSGKPPLTAINPDEAVALGAAIQAALEMEGVKGAAAPLYKLAGRKQSIDVMSHSLGMIAINDDRSRYINSILLRKNQPIPSTQTRPYTLQVNRRGTGKLEVYMTQGETINPADCAYLGKYVFSDIPTVVGSTVVLDITYAYDKNGVVNVSAVERSTKHPLTLSVEPLPPDVPDRFALPPVQEAVREHLTVYLAFDLSGSMSGAPLAEAQKAAHAFVAQCDLTNTSIGLISFSDSVLVELIASQNIKEITHTIDNLQCGRTGYGNATHPFDVILQHLQQTSGIRYGLVLADGVWSNQSHAVQRAQVCHAANIEIIGIGFGGADQSFLRQISSSDEHSFFTDMNRLTETFSTIAQELTESGGTGSFGRLRTHS